MRVLLIGIGSYGDILPFITIGVELKRRGHQVKLLANRYFEDLIRGAGLEAAPLGSREQYLECFGQSEVWHSQRGFGEAAKQLILPAVRPTYAWVLKNNEPGDTVVVASYLALGARLAQEKWSIPTVSVHLYPYSIRSVFDMPVQSKWRDASRMPRPIKAAYFRWVDRMADQVLLPEINAFRAELGLIELRRVLDRWLNSPQCVIGLFPEWYASPQPDWPEQLRLTDFPLYDAEDTQPLPAKLATFLADGTPPVAFCAGTGMSQAQNFFQESVKACRLLHCRGILLSTFSEQIPRPLPSDILSVPYAPFSQLFPRLAAVVHHGGIGTTSQALAAAIPQVIMPVAYDQPDNASRIERLGVGRSISPKAYKATHVASLLGGLWNDPFVKFRCRIIAKRFKGVRPLDRTCDLIEACLPQGAPKEPAALV